MKVVTDNKEKDRIVKDAHAGPTSGHFGITRTWKRISERFYWKGMYEDVKKQVSVIYIK